VVRWAEVSNHQSFDDFFWDMPWGKCPEDRQSIFVAPATPRGLLGGSSGPPRPSKLAQLAAARKKKIEDKKAQENAGTIQQQVDKPNPPSQADGKPTSGFVIRKKHASNMDISSNSDRSGITNNVCNFGSSTGFLKSQEATQTKAEAREKQKSGITTELDISSLKSEPSAFAQALFGSSLDKSQRPGADATQAPWNSSNVFLDAFLEPSPDDIVLAAQAKGSHYKKGQH
jgi:elongation factor 1 alpha-like protein